MSSCARCDFRPTIEEGAQSPREQLAEHAVDAGHPLCVCGPHSLTPFEARVCEKCLTKAQANLARIVELYALLPEQVGHVKAQVYDRDSRGGADDAEVMGGPALAMLGPGGTGQAYRRLWPSEVGRTEGREHAVDNLPDDPTAVAFALGQAEDDWRHTFGEPAAEQEATVAGAAGYLERWMRYAANHHDAFDEFAVDLKRLVTDLEAATSTSDRPKRDPVACFDCGESALERAYRKADPCDHLRPTFPAEHAVETVDGQERIRRRTLTDRRRIHEADLKAWAEAHASCDQGGLEADWTCQSCHRRYTDAEYWQAVHQAMHERAQKRKSS